MMLAAWVLTAGLILIGATLAGRLRAARIWRKQLHAFRVFLPSGLKPEDVTRWLGMVATSLSVPSWSLQPPSIMAWEIRAAHRTGIEHYVLVPKYVETVVLDSIRAGLPGTRVQRTQLDIAATKRMRYCRELRLTNSRRALATERAEAVAAAFLTSLQPLASGQEIRATWYIGGAPTPRRTAAPKTTIHSSIWSAVDESAHVQERERRVKHRTPLLLVAVRIGATASTTPQARAHTMRAAVTLRGMNTPGVHVTYLRWLPSQIIAGRMARYALPLTAWNIFNAEELSGLIGLPIGSSYIAGLALGTSRQLPPSPSASRRGVIVARSNYPGMDQALCLDMDDRLRHIWLFGPTGVGKSTLMASMALQDAAAGRGFVLIDPKTDLVADVLARLPESRRNDVILLDPSAFANDQPIVGCNMLGYARSDHERELATDQIVHVMGSIWSSSFGPRTTDVLRSALLTLAYAKGRDGSAFTLIDVAELLTDPVFRRFVVTQPGVPAVIRPFWSAYDAYSDAQRLQIIGPSLNKLRALSTRTSLRLMLGQSMGIDIGDVINRGKILLVPLSKGAVGAETASLLGSLLVSALVNAIFARATIPAARRRPVIVYLDEFQDVLRISGDIADALAQARGLRAGFVLANQYLGQLPDAMKRAVLGTVRSSVVFQLRDYDDARVLERHFAPLTANDLLHLPAYEVAASLCERNSTGRPVTGVTLSLPDTDADGSELATYSAARYGVRRNDIEAAISARITPGDYSQPPAKQPTFGRRIVGKD